MASSFGQDFLKGFFGSDYLKDYRHAAKTYLSNGSELLPKQKFLFHVYFNLNTDQIPSLRQVFGGLDQSVVGLMVKSVQLPNFQIEVDELNQYNRNRLIQKKIKYQPVQIDFNDDGGDLVRKLWYNYYTYYYKDPSYRYDSDQVTDGTLGTDITPAGFNYNDRNPYENSRTVNDWGYVGESYSDGTSTKDGKPAFFKDIRIYGMSQHRFYEYVLINPLITDFRGDTYDYASSEGMTSAMTIKYETVKYRNGVLNGDSGAPIKGFAQPEYYDKEKSALSKGGGTASILGPGGLLDTGVGILNDLQSGSIAGVIGAVQKAGSAYETFKGKDLRAIVNQEAIDNAKKVLRNGIGTNSVRQAANTRGGFSFPTPPATGVGAPNTTTTGTPPFIAGPDNT